MSSCPFIKTSRLRIRRTVSPIRLLRTDQLHGAQTFLRN